MTGYKSPPAKRSTIRVQPLYPNLERLAAMYALGMTWKAIGAEIGVSAATVRRAVVLGLYPANNKDRAALGVPEVAEVEVCPRCHTTHQRKTCPPKKTAAPRRKRLNRLALWLWAAWLARERLTTGGKL